MSDVNEIVDDFSLRDYEPSTFQLHLTKHKLPETVFHYTGQSGLIGIVESSQLHATKVQYMNDSTEFRLALDLAKAQLKLSCGNFHSDSPNKQAGDFLMNITDNMENVNIFAVSFCEESDLLSQWRGYSDDAYGYAIGFNSKRLKARAKTGSDGCILGKCIYRPADHAAIIREIVEQCLQYVEKRPHALPQLGISFAFLLWKYGAFLKHEGFEGEAEWRLLLPPITPPDKIRKSKKKMIAFKVGRSMPKPYYKISIGKKKHSAIHTVRVGPCPHSELSKTAVLELLRASEVGKEDFVVNSSSIPFRSW